MYQKISKILKVIRHKQVNESTHYSMYHNNDFN